MTYVILLIIGAVVYAIARYIIGMIKEAGSVMEENDRLKNDMELDKKRADAMMKDQTIDQTIRDLIDGKF